MDIKPNFKKLAILTVTYIYDTLLMYRLQPQIKVLTVNMSEFKSMFKK